MAFTMHLMHPELHNLWTICSMRRLRAQIINQQSTTRTAGQPPRPVVCRPPAQRADYPESRDFH
jgi:hypothetical protein